MATKSTKKSVKKSTEKKARSTEVQAGEYNNNPIFRIVKEGAAEDDYPIISFGQSKAQLIVEHFEAIKHFAKTGEIDG